MKELWLFTRQFPEGRGEAFLHTALTVWARHYDRVRVVPMFRGEGRAEMPGGVELVHLWDDAYRSLPKVDSLRQAPAILRAWRHRRGGGHPAHALSHVRQLMYKRDRVIAGLMPHYRPGQVHVLAAWMEDWVNVLGLVKERHPELRFATMAHRSDLFAERRAHGRIPFRAWQMERVDRVIAISQDGVRYLKERFPHHADKVALSYLGSPDLGPGPWSPADTLRIASCAYLRPPKRVDLIARALAHVSRPVEWTHFGDGPDRGALEALVRRLPGHITVRLMGNVPPPQVMAWYKSVPVDLFLHLSAHEGVPVALMEAIGFGIPVWGSDVGGVSELLAPEAGILLPADIDEHRLAALIDGPEAARWCTAEARAAVRQWWADHFAAERNFARMPQLLP
jgi:glycosyltransferase involved in cell wall biosynthesis